MVEECKKGFSKKTNIQENETQSRMSSVQNDTQKENKLHTTKSVGKTTTNTVQKCLKNPGSLSDLDLVVLPLTSNGFINPQKNNNQNNTPETVAEKLLKPLSGCSIYGAEWKEFAEVISKEICVTDLNVHWNDIMGLEEAKRLLKEAVVYPTKYPELFSGVLAPWKGLLLYGPPGTGKTLLAKAVATECKTTFFNISASSIVSKWRGDSEKLVRVMFELARYHAPSTIFLDEIDALASHRDGAGEHEGSRRLKAELLIQLDGLANCDDRVFLLATSNLPWELDAAILRRLEKRILVDLPNIEAREAMIRHYLPPVVIEKPALLCELDYKLLAHSMGGYSGSDIKLVCKEAAMNTMRTAFSILETSKSGIKLCSGIQLTAYISESGLHGEVIFQQQSGNGSSIIIRTELQATDEQSQWTWTVRDLPVFYTDIENRCSDEKLGPVTLNLDEKFGPLELPTNGSVEFTSSNNEIMLTGSKGLWGKSILFEMVDDRTRRACATITVSGNADEKIAEARFLSPIAGSVFMRWVGSHHSGSTDTLLHTNLYHVNANEKTANTEHNWKIYTTDILDSEADKSRENCNFLQLVFDPVFSTPPGQAVGDLDTRLGKVKVAGDPRKQMPSAMGVYHDEGLTSLSVDLLSGQRSLYLVIFDSRHHDSFLACAKIREIHPAVLKSVIQKDGVTGDVTLIQRSPFDPTWIRMNLTSTRDSLTGSTSTVTSYKIQELPPLPYTPANENPCQKTGSVFNPSNIEEEQASGSQETYAIGDLSGKHNMWQQEQTFDDLNGQRWDIFLPLYGPHSVAHRSVVFYRKNGSSEDANNVPWVCGSLARYTSADRGWKVPIFTAGVVFRYPTVGRIIFRQPRDQPWADTTVIVEMLVHSDGTSLNNTADHRWAVHLDPRGKDYYNWTGRCLSAGPIFNPYKIPFNNSETDSLCGTHRPGYCRLGDLSTRLGTLSIAGRKKNAEKLTRRLFTDQLLPLSGSASIMGRTLVLYDDNGPKARGERLACSIIYGIYRRKAVIKDWYGNGIPTTLKGKIELFQQTEYDVTDIEVDLEGLVDNSGYHIHVAPVQEQLEFPCEGSSLYGHWNPYNVNPSLSPPASKGTSDQYEMGDLSGKFGLLDNLISLDATYNDTRLPLFGTNAVLGRSVIIHKKDKNMRWVCSSIERGYAPGEARELRAIASFHHPLGYAYGYIRMTQLVYNDGSKSETVIEVNLRHPGKHDRNLTRNHHWAIYVNPVGVDATVKIQNTRCVAGGYRWNPFYTQLADPLNDELYREECGPDNPLRCYVGDVSGRLGTINLGDKRQVFTDSNFPLEGDVSAMGRSIVIFDKEGGGDRFACANIEPDKDIIKYANIRKPPRFVVAQFIEDVREVMGLPEWMLTVDSRKTRTLHGGTCIQFLLHFKGAQANQLEQDFSRLLANGFLGSLSLYNPGYVPSVKRKTHLSYRPCGTRDPNEKNTRTSVNNASSLTPMPSILCSLILIIIIYLQNT